MKSDFRILVPGGLNTDIIGMDVEQIVGKGELTLGGTLRVGPGGKARNMAQMCSELMATDQLAMIGRTVRDPFGLWSLPVDSLKSSGVNTDYIKIQDFDPAEAKYPGVALIPVDRKGNNQIYVLPGVNADFSPDDIDNCRYLFEQPGKPWVLMALEIPLATVIKVLEVADDNELKVIIDPGGIEKKHVEALKPALKNVFILKPNEYEAEILSGIKVKDFNSATEAGRRLLQFGVNYVFITRGEEGGYLFGEGLSKHIRVPQVHDTGARDATGCGDQVTATLLTALINDYTIENAAEMAIKAGTMQFYRSGIDPITKSDLGI